MTTLLTIFQFIIVVIICITVLLQKSSSIGLGAYSGSNESFFGAKGPAGFLAKFTFIMGLVLIANTIALGYFYNNTSKNSLAEKIKIESNSSIPKIPLTIPNSLNSNAPLAPVTSNNTTKENNAQ